MNMSGLQLANITSNVQTSITNYSLLIYSNNYLNVIHQPIEVYHYIESGKVASAEPGKRNVEWEVKSEEIWTRQCTTQLTQSASSRVLKRHIHDLVTSLFVSESLSVIKMAFLWMQSIVGFFMQLYVAYQIWEQYSIVGLN